MADLSPEHKRFIVESLACYDTPTMVQTSLKERYGIEVSLPGINYYNPETAQGKRELGQEWKDLFAAKRKAFDSEVETIPIARLSFRLRRLQRIVDSPKADKMPGIVKDVLKQVAMEVGGMFERKADESGDDSGATLSAELNAAIDKIYGVSDVPPDSGQ